MYSSINIYVTVNTTSHNYSDTTIVFLQDVPQATHKVLGLAAEICAHTHSILSIII